MRFSHRLAFLLVLRPVVLWADYFDDTGYRSLAAELGNALPNGTGVSVTQVEAGGMAGYLPVAGTGSFPGSGAFAGKSFNAKSGPSAASAHALAVASHFYSLNTDPAARAGFAPGITIADLYNVDSWAYEGWLEPTPTSAPLTESRAVQNHSWIGNSTTRAEDKAALQRLDYAIVRDGFLAVTGVNNGTSTVPALMASAYNNLAVGLSTGSHSTGGVIAGLDGAGRQKPEITAPLDYASFSCALVSSAAALLRQTANSQGANAAAASRPETLKAILLAGATKEEFPGWSHTSSLPLDTSYGAGEMNIAHSWHILAGQAQSANLSPPVPAFAWARTTLTTSSTADYRLTIPTGFTGAVFSAVAAWNRIITDSNPGPGFTMAVAPLADYQLALARLPAAGSPQELETSNGSLHNLEHLYRTQLPSGTYRLRLSLASGSGVPASLAWRLTTVPHRPALTVFRTGSTVTLDCTGLIPGQAYLIQGSANLATWSPEFAFTATGTSTSWSTLPGTRRFFRLAATD